jgi:hypothetical protein
MELWKAGTLAGGDPAVIGERVCPRCGAPMVEFDRREEDGAVFIWYVCTRDRCTGQWLAKRALRMCSI